MKPLIRLLYVDETDDFTDEALKTAAERIYGLYLYDVHLHVHCCEITPSYEMTFVGFQTKAWIPDALQMNLLDCAAVQLCDAPVCYRHCWWVDSMPRHRLQTMARQTVPVEKRAVALLGTSPTGVDRNEAIEGWREYLSCNGYTA